MTRRRFIADQWDREAGNASLLGEQAHHLATVLRARPGQTYDVVAGGFLHRAEITAVDPGPPQAAVHFHLLEELEAETRLDLHLLLSVFKFDHLEWAIEKTTELGVDRITPILARRTEKHLGLAAPKRVERWRRIALEASKQSRRTAPPQLDDPLPLSEALLAPFDGSLCLLLSELEQATSLASALSAAPEANRFALAIGPEGGWTPDEIALFQQHSWRAVTLGSRILRAETAAIAATAILGAHLV